VRGRADQLDAAHMGLMIRFRTLEPGQKGMMNIDASTESFALMSFDRICMYRASTPDQCRFPSPS
jgi:hypothetical protein